MNPCIRKTGTGYEVICRTVNYTQMGAKIFETNDLKGIFEIGVFFFNTTKILNSYLNARSLKFAREEYILAVLKGWKITVSSTFLRQNGLVVQRTTLIRQGINRSRCN